jgi:hypothetical protein
MIWGLLAVCNRNIFVKSNINIQHDEKDIDYLRFFN